ncbi:bifunctional nuclease family protein [Ferroglobus sp.]|uniref:bifunctional nuclease family protein n=1 Tax=Ferroglobus sp. TaxID=2614230 RepID=UPI0025B95E59|nr:bifunctional nuclease family protein [Ferroglobus sp.]
MESDLLKAEIKGVYAATTVFGMSPVVVLSLEDGRMLPIYIGIPEAVAIFSALKNQTPPRPMTHDLIVEIIQRLKARVARVVIDDIIESTYYATIYLEVDNIEVEVDARPSDSIAIALRTKAPIFVRKAVIDEVGGIDKIPDDYVDFESFV